MAGPIVISILANASQAKSEINGTLTTAQKAGAGFRKMALPATAAIATLAAAGKAAIDSASDLGEEISKTGQVFGPQAAEIEKFAARAEKALGQSRVSALSAASTFGIIAEKAGLGDKETAEFSKTFVTLASDLASFNNTSPEEAITAIGAAMRGEAEPIRKYGVLLDDATLRSRALKLGLIDNIKQGLTPQQKALAASKEILAQTSKAQGDFARTSDGAANKARIQAAQAENLKAKIGKGLLPVYIQLQTKTSELIDFASKHSRETKIVAAAVGGLAVAVLAVNAAMAVGRAGMVVYTGVTRLLGLQSEETTRSLNRGRLAAGAAGAGLLALAGSGAAGSGGLSKVATVAGATAAGFAVAGPWGAVAGAGASLISLAGKSEESARRQEAFLAIQKQISSQAATLTATLDGQTGAITRNTRETIIKNLADNGAFTAADKVGISYDTVTRAALGNAEAQRQVTAAVNAYTDRQTENIDGVENAVKAYGKAKLAVEPLTGSVKQFSGELGRAKTATNQTKNAIAQMEARAKDSAAAMRGAGSNAGQGFRDGVAGWLDNIVAVGRSIAAAVAKAAEDKLKVKSPSRVMRQIGEYAGQGLADGITATTPDAVNAINETIRRTTRAAQQRLDFSAIGPGLDAAGFALAFNGSGGPAIENTYYVTVEVTDTMSPVEQGRKFAKAIKEYERSQGAGR